MSLPVLGTAYKWNHIMPRWDLQPRFNSHILFVCLFVLGCRDGGDGTALQMGGPPFPEWKMGWWEVLCWDRPRLSVRLDLSSAPGCTQAVSVHPVGLDQRFPNHIQQMPQKFCK